MRVVEIENEKKETDFFSTDDLPIVVLLIKNEANEVFLKLISENNKQENVDKKSNQTICAYIASEEEHLFFQPDNNSQTDLIFHNDEVINCSVWLKSGDIIQIEKKQISYRVSGDKIKIIISGNDKKNVKPPSSHLNDVNSFPEHHKIIIDKKTPHAKNQTFYKQKFNKLIVILLLLLLGIISVFVSLAETVEISIKPEADNISLAGFVPGIKLGKRYLVLSGHYSLEAEKKGYKLLKENLIISAENRKFSFSMKENSGFLELKIIPDKNNKIFLNDQLLTYDINKKNYAMNRYEVDKGVYKMEIINPRYKKYQKIIRIEGKNKLQKYHIGLKKNWGELKLETLTKDVIISIYSGRDSERVSENTLESGQNPIYSESVSHFAGIELISGLYTIYVKKNKYQTKKISIKIKAEEVLRLKALKLDKANGILNIDSLPSGAIVRVDKQYAGKTPLTVKLRPEVEHDIELSLNGHITFYKSFNLKSERIIDKKIYLAKKNGLVFISVLPEQADLYIDGVKQKSNSSSYSLKQRKHLITAKASGYQTQSKEINIGSFSKNISLTLVKKKKKKPINIVSNISNKSYRITNTQSYRNSIDQKMILIKQAVFMMGSKKNEAGRSANESLQKIQLNYDYFLSEKEINNKQYRQYKPSHNSGISINQSLNSDTQPVVNVTWHDAAQFANWLSIKESLNPYYKEVNGRMVAVNSQGRINGYRLPFEAEWTLAARGRQHNRYPWSGQYPPKDGLSGNFADVTAAGQLAYTLLNYNDKKSVSAPIGSYKKNKMGFYDLGGNVSEWCHDYYSPSRLSSGKIMINPVGPEKGTHRVVRDSSWRDASIKELRLSYRLYSNKKSDDTGFRIARYTQ